MSMLRDPGAARRGDQPAAQASPHLGASVTAAAVVKSYGPVKALRGVSLAVAAGECVTITGPSGSGKSTLLNLLGSLDRPDSGKIAVDGMPVPEPGAALEFRRRLVGFVFQDNLLLPYLSAQSNVETALLATGVPHHQRRERARELLAEVGLAHRSATFPQSSRAASGSGWRSPAR